MLTTMSKDAISLVPLSALSFSCIGGLRVNLICEGIVEVKLRRKLIVTQGRRIGANLEVDVNRSAWVPIRVNRHEFHSSIGVCHLIATQELLPDGTETWVCHVRIDAQCVTMPNVHGCTASSRRGYITSFLLRLNLESFYVSIKLNQNYSLPLA